MRTNMKAYLGIILSWLMLGGCGADKDRDTPENRPGVFEFPETLRGAYISTPYLDALKKNRSTKASQEYAVLSNMVIVQKNGEVLLSTFWNFHESGGTHPVKMTSETKGQTLELESQPPMYRFDMLDEKTVKISDESQQYLMTRCSDAPDVEACQQLINKMLLPDKYDLNGQAVSFESDGTVNGIPGLLSYRFNLDYYDAGMEFDKVFLTFADKSEPEVFGYEITPDHLEIFELKCDGEDLSDPSSCMRYSRGPSRYWLTKWQPAEG